MNQAQANSLARQMVCVAVELLLDKTPGLLAAYEAEDAERIEKGMRAIQARLVYPTVCSEPFGRKGKGAGDDD